MVPGGVRDEDLAGAVGGLMDGNVVGGVPELAVDFVGTQGDAGLHQEAVKLGLDAQEGFGGGFPGPGG